MDRKPHVSRPQHASILDFCVRCDDACDTTMKGIPLGVRRPDRLKSPASDACVAGIKKTQPRKGLGLRFCLTDLRPTSYQKNLLPCLRTQKLPLRIRNLRQLRLAVPDRPIPPPIPETLQPIQLSDNLTPESPPEFRCK